MTHRLIPLLAFVVLFTACSSTQPLTEDEALWCRAYVPPFLIENEAQEMGIDIEAAMDEAQIAYDMEGIIGADPVGQIDAFYEVIEEAEPYIQVCRSIYDRSR